MESHSNLAHFNRILIQLSLLKGITHLSKLKRTQLQDPLFPRTLSQETQPKTNLVWTEPRAPLSAHSRSTSAIRVAPKQTHFRVSPRRSLLKLHGSSRTCLRRSSSRPTILCPGERWQSENKVGLVGKEI